MIDETFVHQEISPTLCHSGQSNWVDVLARGTSSLVLPLATMTGRQSLRYNVLSDAITLSSGYLALAELLDLRTLDANHCE